MTPPNVSSILPSGQCGTESFSVWRRQSLAARALCCSASTSFELSAGLNTTAFELFFQNYVSAGFNLTGVHDFYQSLGASPSASLGSDAYEDRVGHPTARPCQDIAKLSAVRWQASRQAPCGDDPWLGHLRPQGIWAYQYKCRPLQASHSHSCSCGRRSHAFRAPCTTAYGGGGKDGQYAHVQCRLLVSVLLALLFSHALSPWAFTGTST